MSIRHANANIIIVSQVSVSFSYTPFNKISYVAQGESRTNITSGYQISYGLDRQRIKTEYFENRNFENGDLRQIRYYFGTYEKEIDVIC